jgi:hypothetical protein
MHNWGFFFILGAYKCIMGIDLVLKDGCKLGRRNHFKMQPLFNFNCDKWLL